MVNMTLDSEELKKMLKKRRRRSKASEEVFKEQPSVRIAKRLVDVRTGAPIAEEEEVVSIRPKREVLEEEIIRTVETCPTCGRPITQELLSRHEVKTCMICRRDTCPACRVNTSIQTIDVRYRGQIVCQDCFRIFGECQICKVLTHPDRLIRCEDCDRLVCLDHARKVNKFLFWLKVVCVICAGEFPLIPARTPIPVAEQGIQSIPIAPTESREKGALSKLAYYLFEYPVFEKWKSGLYEVQYPGGGRWITCPNCNGTGRTYSPWFGYATCKTCNGIGRIRE